MSNIGISLIIPVYNGEKYLRECLDSVLEQTYKNIEVICVNDGSTDGSLNILKDYEKRDSRFKIIDQKNQGQSVARNAGIKKAEGKYIAFLDCDDYIKKDMLEKMLNKAEDTNAEIVICNMLLFFEDTLQLRNYRDEPLYYSLRNRVFSLSECPEIIKSIGIWDRIFKKDFLDKFDIRFVDGKVYEDALFCIEADVYAKKMALIPEHLYYYRKNAGNSITDNEKCNDNYKEDFIYIQKKIQEILKKEKSSEYIISQYMEYFLMNARMHQINSTNYHFFKWFFNEVRKIMTEDLVRIASKIDNRYVNEYIEYLCNNDVKNCYRKMR